MKKLIFVFAIMAAFLTSCGGGGTSIVGTWQLESVSGEELTDSEKEAVITFNEDGTCERKRGEHSKSFKWKMSEDGKTVTLTEEDGDENEMTDVVLSADKLVFSERNDKITLKRIK